jgi:hypothetical protein
MRKTEPENAMVLGNYVQFRTSYCNWKSWLAPSNIGAACHFPSKTIQRFKQKSIKLHGQETNPLLKAFSAYLGTEAVEKLCTSVYPHPLFRP